MPFDERAQLVHDNRVTGRGEHVEQRLRAEHLSDRRGQRRPADLGSDPDELGDRLVEPRPRSLCPQIGVERSDEARRQVVLGGTHGNTRSKWGHRFVADVFVDYVGRLPESRHVDVAVEPEPRKRLSERLARDAVQRERDRIDGRCDQVGSGTSGLEGRGQRVAARALAVDTDRKTGRLA